MNMQTSQRPDETSSAKDALIKLRTGPDPLMGPTTLAGTWPALHDPARNPMQHTEVPQRDHALHHVYALDAVKTSLTALCQHALRSMRSWESVPSIRFPFGRLDSQGRMDLLTMMTEKAKDFVNPARTRNSDLDGSMAKAGH